MESYSLISLAAKGGWLMLVLLALSVIAVYLLVSRLLAIRKASRIEGCFTKDLNDYIQEGKLRSAMALCKHFDSPLARMSAKGLSRIGRPVTEIREAMESVGNLEVARLEKGLPVLAAIAGGAPMIGFLGTVIGMVQAFFNMSQAGNNVDISLLSGGIYTAMITTVGGLVVGIVAYFGYNYLTARISALVLKLDAGTVSFLDAVVAARAKAASEEKR